jgi:hypothetical protein
LLEYYFYDPIISSLDHYQVFDFGRQTFFFSVPCAIMKSVEGFGLFVGTLISFGVGYLMPCFGV